MPTFIEITPDPFAERFDSDTEAVRKSRSNGLFDSKKSFAHVRRPVRGIQIKDDTYATIQVRKADGKPIPLLDGGGEEDPDNPGISTSDKYSNFLLQQIQEQRSEKTQVVQTFGEPFIFFFGEHPRIVQGSGILLNTEDFNWRAEFWENYDRYLRGSKCVQNKTRITMSWDDVVIEGYFIQANATESAQNNNVVNFSFQIFLTNYTNVSAIGGNDFPSGSFEGLVNPDEVDIPGIGVFPSTSQTETVRQLNLQDPTQFHKGSLFQALRNGINDVAEFEGRLETLFNLTSNLVGGNKKVRVPIGVAGGSVFDVDTQLALASINPNTPDVVVRLTPDGTEYWITNVGGRLTQPARFGKFKDAEDEYIAKYPSTGGDPTRPIQVFKDQEADFKDLERKLREAISTHEASRGVAQGNASSAQTGATASEPPAESIKLAQGLSFGTVQLPSSSDASDEGDAILADINELI